MLTSAPALINSLTTSPCPFLEADHNRFSFFELTSAPALISS